MSRRPEPSRRGQQESWPAGSRADVHGCHRPGWHGHRSIIAGRRTPHIGLGEREREHFLRAISGVRMPSSAPAARPARSLPGHPTILPVMAAWSARVIVTILVIPAAGHQRAPRCPPAARAICSPSPRDQPVISATPGEVEQLLDGAGRHQGRCESGGCSSSSCSSASRPCSRSTRACAGSASRDSVRPSGRRCRLPSSLRRRSG